MTKFETLENNIYETVAQFLFDIKREYYQDIKMSGNKLTPKLVEYTENFIEYVDYKLTGKTSQDRGMEALEKMFE